MGGLTVPPPNFSLIIYTRQDMFFLELVMILAGKVKTFDADARQRAIRGLRPNMALLLEAINDAIRTGDHIGLTVLRRRIEEALEYVPPGTFYNVLEQLRREVQISERAVVCKHRPD
jgi:hypothetical protein